MLVFFVLVNLYIINFVWKQQDYVLLYTQIVSVAYGIRMQLIAIQQHCFHEYFNLVVSCGRKILYVYILDHYATTIKLHEVIIYCISHLLCIMFSAHNLDPTLRKLYIAWNYFVHYVGCFEDTEDIASYMSNICTLCSMHWGRWGHCILHEQHSYIMLDALRILRTL